MSDYVEPVGWLLGLGVHRACASGSCACDVLSTQNNVV